MRHVGRWGPAKTALTGLMMLLLPSLTSAGDGLSLNEAVPVIELWDDDDDIIMYYAEFLLASWVLESAPFNTYHSGLSFHNVRLNETTVFDFTPYNPTSVLAMVVPKVEGTWVQRLVGDIEVRWADDAYLEFYPNAQQDRWQQFTEIGQTKGRTFKIWVDWAIHDYAPTHLAFQPAELVLVSQLDKGGQASAGKPVLSSQMCHDFVTDSLWVLYDLGVRFEAKDDIFRDHIFIYAGSYELAPSSRDMMRKYFRYLSLLAVFYAEVAKEFTAARKVLAVAWKLGLPLFHHHTDQDFIVRLVPPFINYCYLPLALPPQKHDPFVKRKLCALGLEANLNNISIPFPAGYLLATANQVDTPVGLVLVPIAIIVGLIYMVHRCCCRRRAVAKGPAKKVKSNAGKSD